MICLLVSRIMLATMTPLMIESVHLSLLPEPTNVHAWVHVICHEIGAVFDLLRPEIS